MEEYDFGKDHPFTGDRFISFPKLLDNKLEEGDYEILGAEPVSKEELFRIASKDYVDFTSGFFNSSEVNRDSSEFGKFHSADNFPGRRSGKLETAARAVLGQAKKAAELVCEGAEKAISIGGGFHHAKPNSGEGFCLYNDVAYASEYLLADKGVDRVLVLDTDAHAGNGTYEYFSGDPRVLQVDIHQDPTTIYPGTGFVEEIGTGEGEGYTVNVPLPEGAGDKSYRLLFEEIVTPVATQFSPSVIIRNGGGDPYFGDPLTNLGLTLNGLKMLGSLVNNLRKELDCGLIDLIVSGYSGEELHQCWFALLAGLMGKKVELPGSDGEEVILSSTKELIAEVKSVQRAYWDF